MFPTVPGRLWLWTKDPFNHSPLSRLSDGAPGPVLFVRLIIGKRTLRGSWSAARITRCPGVLEYCSRPKKWPNSALPVRLSDKTSLRWLNMLNCDMYWSLDVEWFSLARWTKCKPLTCDIWLRLMASRIALALPFFFQDTNFSDVLVSSLFELLPKEYNQFTSTKLTVAQSDTKDNESTEPQPL
jgi:hypothetical protein